MKRLLKIIPKDSTVPEFRYFVITPSGGIAWNGMIGIKYDIRKLGQRIQDLVAQHGTFAIIDTIQFLRILSAIDKITAATISKRDSLLTIKANDGMVTVRIPIRLNLPPTVPHLNIEFGGEGREISISGVWHDTQDLITSEALQLWGDVVGVYDGPNFTASFDYGVLLIQDKKTTRRKADWLCYCPINVLNLGLQGINEALWTDDGKLYVHGEDVTYYCQPAVSKIVLDQMLSVRDEVEEAARYPAQLTFASGLWKRAKVFSSVAVTMEIKSGSIRVYNGDWSEILGTTTAPDAKFVTRISLLQRWTTATLSHQIEIVDGFSDDQEPVWYLTGSTRKNSQFYGVLTNIGEDGADEDTGVDLEDFDSDTLL